MSSKKLALFYIFLILSTQAVKEVEGPAFIPLITVTAAYLMPILKSIGFYLGVALVAGVAIGIGLANIYDALHKEENAEMVEGLFPVKIIAHEQEFLCKLAAMLKQTNADPASLVYEKEWTMEEVFRQLGVAFGSEISKFCMVDNKGKPKMVKKTKDHFALLLIWAVKMDEIHVEEC